MPSVIAQRIEQHRRMLFRQARRLTGNHWRAQDLVQETLLRALENEDKFEGDDDALASWLFVIMQRRYFDDYRRRKLHVRSMKRYMPLLPLTCKNEGDSNLEFLEMLRRLRIIPAEQRRALLAVAVAEVSYHEVARMEGVPEGTIKSRVHRARLALDM